MEIEEGVIRRGSRPRWITPSEIRKMTTIVKGDGPKKGRQPEKP